MQPPIIKKGDRVRAIWLQATNASLAGTQPKVGATTVIVEGRVTHIRGDHPTHPTTVGVWIQPDEGPEVIAKLEHVVAKLDPVTAV